MKVGPKNQASSLLVIAILGGALLPRALGEVADRWGIQVAFVVPMIAFAYVYFLWSLRLPGGPEPVRRPGPGRAGREQVTKRLYR